MARRAARRWLESELPRLVEAGVVPPEVARRIEAHYAAAAGAAAAVPLFALIGTSLIGLGLILLLAANWEDLGRVARTALCFALLLAGQAVAGYALLRRRGSVAWSEGGAVGLALVAAAVIALVGQTWQVQGDLRSFLVAWLPLVLPLLWLFDSRGAAALALAGTFGWLAAALEDDAARWSFWLFFAAVLAWVAPAVRRGEAPLRDAFVTAVAVPVAVFAAVAGFRVEAALSLALLASAALAAIYALGAAFPDAGGDRALHAGSCRLLAGLALVAGLVALGFEASWGFVGERAPIRGHVGLSDQLGAAVVGAGAAGLALAGGVRLLRRGDWPRALLAFAPLLVAAGAALERAFDTRLPATALASLWLLAYGVGTALAGMADDDVRRANAGLLVLAALVFARFADWNLSYAARGVVFIAFGVVFLLLNVRLRRGRREPAP